MLGVGRLNSATLLNAHRQFHLRFRDTFRRYTPTKCDDDYREEPEQRCTATGFAIARDTNELYCEWLLIGYQQHLPQRRDLSCHPACVPTDDQQA